MKHVIRKAVFPVAGFGTRFLPVTKSIPKEMLPIVDKPMIQYAVEEAVAAGIRELIFVTSANKNSIGDYFDSNVELEHLLKRQQKYDLLKMVQNILPENVSCVFVRQHAMLGLGHAILCARDVVGDEPFAILLVDDVIDNNKNPCLKQLVDVYEKEQGSVVAVQHLAEEELSKYGVVDLAGVLDHYARMVGVVEKPKAGNAPSHFGVVGRYVLTPKIFELLADMRPGAGGEIQLTDAIAQLLEDEAVFALEFEGKRYDCGSKLGYLEATIQYGLKHPEISKDFLKMLKALKL
ncbi:MAG: UTP--glucose-1-phosphate uridylyltransferase [Gammaproteobacteria bacterium RIFCSPHIGHO2_02_FULL_42_13]|nr:MAG: UTP--glucose-1-phosphate uridylyltransferase [Gammaproteobacteria bacterium RIFCSPHIGHO2_02_FULL_42_13]OGT70974.1 MAG: UTP--glucose-1-phosphate uridylyltransferase [Gammaproteobacteria bacterium RIFCSPLOWO2_02_FULL_42_9]